MDHEPLNNIPITTVELNKKIGGIYYRFVTIIAVDDTVDDYLIIHTYGGKLLIDNPEHRKEFLDWYSKAHKATQHIGHLPIPRRAFDILGEW